jgi:hypothetical protein
MWRTRIEKEWDSEEVKMDGKKRKKDCNLQLCQQIPRSSDRDKDR